MEENRIDAEKGRMPEERMDAPNTPDAPTPEAPEASSKAAPDAPAAAGACGAEPARDRKAHRTIVVCIVAFALLLIGASIAYSMLAPEAEKSDLVATPSYKDASAMPGQEDRSGRDGTAPGGNAGGSADAADRTAPDFTAVDVDGKEVTLADFRGRPVVLNFWASWCGPCQSEMPAFESAYQTYGDDVQFLMVNMTGMSGESRETAMRLIEAEDYTFPVFFDQNSSAARAYGVTSIPQTWFIDADGTVAARAMGALSEAKLQQGIELITQ